MLRFAKKPYADVTLREIENATGLSRGTVMYHITNKETLFREAVDMFVFRQNTLTSLAEDPNRSLKDTISEFIKMLGKEQRRWKRNGIRNINFALVNIQMSCYNVIKDSLKNAGKWYESECAIWKEVIVRAILTSSTCHPKIF